jgi:hypothetical protein
MRFLLAFLAILLAASPSYAELSGCNAKVAHKPSYCDSGPPPAAKKAPPAPKKKKASAQPRYIPPSPRYIPPDDDDEPRNGGVLMIVPNMIGRVFSIF